MTTPEDFLKDAQAIGEASMQAWVKYWQNMGDAIKTAGYTAKVQTDELLAISFDAIGKHHSVPLIQEWAKNHASYAIRRERPPLEISDCTQEIVLGHPLGNAILCMPENPNPDIKLHAVFPPNSSHYSNLLDRTISMMMKKGVPVVFFDFFTPSEMAPDTQTGYEDYIEAYVDVLKKTSELATDKNLYQQSDSVKGKIDAFVVCGEGSKVFKAAIVSAQENDIVPEFLFEMGAPLTPNAQRTKVIDDAQGVDPLVMDMITVNDPISGIPMIDGEIGLSYFKGLSLSRHVKRYWELVLGFDLNPKKTREENIQLHTVAAYSRDFIDGTHARNFVNPNEIEQGEFIFRGKQYAIPDSLRSIIVSIAGGNDYITHPEQTRGVLGGIPEQFQGTSIEGDWGHYVFASSQFYDKETDTGILSDMLQTSHPHLSR